MPAAQCLTAYFSKFAKLTLEKSGLVIDDLNLDSFRISLNIRMGALKMVSYEDYYRYLAEKDTLGHEFNELLNLITVNETFFFRFIEQFEILEKDLLPKLLEKKKASREKLRIWSAACSTGPEPYTIAMIIKELMGHRTTPYIDIIATDVSKKALSDAGKGIYSRRVVEQRTPPQYIKRYFTLSRDKYYLCDQIKNMVDLEYINLIRTPFPSENKRNFDIIFCRNVTIYFKKESTQRVINQFYDSLKEGGYLFLGHSETLDNFDTDFKLIMLQNVFIYKKDTKGMKREIEIKTSSYKRRPFQDNLYADLTRIDLPAPSKIKARPDSLNRAKKLLKENAASAENRHKALLLLNQGLEENPHCAESYLLIAQVQSDMNHHDQALMNCRMAIKLNSCCLEAHLMMGLILMSQGKVSRAVEAMNKVIYLDPRHSLAYFYLGNLYQDHDNPSEAQKAYQQVIRTLKVRKEPIKLGDTSFTADEFRNICLQQIYRLQQEAA